MLSIAVGVNGRELWEKTYSPAQKRAHFEDWKKEMISMGFDPQALDMVVSDEQCVSLKKAFRSVSANWLK